MWVFIFMYIIFAIIGFISKSDYFNRKQICFLCFLLLWIIQALRSTTVGHDSFNTYLPAFSMLNIDRFSDIFSQTVLYNWEKGYVLYESFINYFTKNENLFLAITSAVVLMPISNMIKRYSETPWLSFVIFASLIIYHFSFSGLRQAIAIAITCYSVRYIEEGKIVPFLFFVFLATQFHTSAIVFVIAYPLSRIDFTYIRGVLVVLMIALLFITIEPLLDFIRPILFGDSKYSSYNEAGGGAIGLTLFYIVLTFFSLIKLYSKDVNHKMISLFAWMTILVLAFQPLALISDVADRVGYYFLPFYSIAIPNALSRFNCDIEIKKILTIGLFVLMVATFFYCNAGGYLEVIPYRFFWEK